MPRLEQINGITYIDNIPYPKNELKAVASDGDLVTVKYTHTADNSDRALCDLFRIPYNEWVNGSGTPYASKSDFLTEANIFFLASDALSLMPLIPNDQRVDNYNLLPSPAIDYDGQYWWSDETLKTGVWPFRNTFSKGAYKSVSGVWEYKGADVPAYFVDDTLLFKDDGTNNGLGFTLDGLTGNRRATWQDKNITVADNQDLLDEAATRQSVDEGTVGVHSDVNLQGVNLSPNSYLIWDGTSFIPVINKLYINPSLVINNTSTPVNIIDVLVSVQRLVPHKIEISYSWSLNDGSQDFVTRSTFGGQFLISALTDNSEIHRQEPKDTGGADPDGRGTNQRHGYSNTFFVTPTVLGDNQFILTMSGAANGDLASIWNTCVKIEEVQQTLN